MRQKVKEVIFVSICTVGLLALFAYATFEDKKDQWNRWKNRYRGTKDDSGTDLLGE
jgi:hypothetical protein